MKVNYISTENLQLSIFIYGGVNSKHQSLEKYSHIQGKRTETKLFYPLNLNHLSVKGHWIIFKCFNHHPHDLFINTFEYSIFYCIKIWKYLDQVCFNSTATVKQFFDFGEWYSYFWRGKYEYLVWATQNERPLATSVCVFAQRWAELVFHCLLLLFRTKTTTLYSENVWCH